VLPPRVTAALHGWAQEAAGGLRVLPAESLHVTLAFLGERPGEQAGAIGAALAPAGVEGTALALSLRRPAALGRGHALAIDLHDAGGACAALQARVADRLGAIGAYAPEERAFRPHVTVARGDRVSVRGLPAVPEVGPFGGEAVALLRSHLGGGPARYEPLASLPVGAGSA
jgi:2'-5' RNA ligase